MKHCIVDGCNAECEKGRRYCRQHYLERKRVMAKARYYAKPVEQRSKRYDVTCIICGQSFRASNHDSKYCPTCYSNLQKIGSCGKNNYENAKGGGHCWMHRKIATQVLNRPLNTNEVVHHLDGNPKNNELTNLLVLSRSKHLALHNYLRMQGAILSKGNIENLENCWETLIVPMTTAWLETTNAKVIKLWEIGQSAAEPLLNGEGSETMHETAKHESAS